jgi:ketosteroid isomerase-like protein
VTENSTRAVIGMLHDAFARGDQTRFASGYDDDVDWTFHAPVSVFSFAGRRIGKAAMLQSLREFLVSYEMEMLAPQVIVAEGERAAALSEVTLLQRSTGRTIRCRVASFYRVRDGRVVEYEGFLDSFDAVEQALGHFVDVEPPMP